MEQTEEQLEADQDKFRKKLSEDQIHLEDKLDTVQMIVAGFAGRTELSKAAEIANEVRRVMKDLKDYQAQAVLYNQRERLFEMPVTSVCMYVDILYIVRDGAWKYQMLDTKIPYSEKNFCGFEL